VATSFLETIKKVRGGAPETARGFVGLFEPGGVPGAAPNLKGPPMKLPIFATALLAASLLAGTSLAHKSGCAAGQESGTRHHRHHGAHFAKLDKNGDKKIDRAEAKQAAEHHFKEMDANNNQIVTQDEALALFQKKRAEHRPSPEQQAAHFKEKDKNQNGKWERSETRMSAERFDSIDQNKDGGLTPDELKTAHQAREKARQDKPAVSKGGPMFKHLDKNNDGQITRLESDEGALSMFDAMDQNKDGYVTQQEARVSFHKHRAHGQAPAKSGTPAAPKK